MPPKREKFLRTKPKSSKKNVIAWIISLDYGIALTATFTLIIFATFHIAWVTDFHLHGIHRPQNVSSARRPSERSNSSNTNTTHNSNELAYVNSHPLLMTLGFFTFQGLGILVFRVCCCYNRLFTLIIHSVLSTVGLIFGVGGILEIQYFYTTADGDWSTPISSFHSIIGVIVICLAVFQIASGLVVFVGLRMAMKYTSYIFRAKWLPYHFYIGLATFLCGVFTIIAGISHATVYVFPIEVFDPEDDSVQENITYAMFSMKTSQILFVVSAIMVYYSLSKDDFRSRGRILVSTDTVETRP